MQVEIYSTPTCSYCQKAKDYFKENKVEFADYNVAEDQEKAKEMTEKSGQMGVPVILVDDEVVIGFDKPKLDQLLGIEK